LINNLKDNFGSWKYRPGMISEAVNQIHNHQQLSQADRNKLSSSWDVVLKQMESRKASKDDIDNVRLLILSSLQSNLSNNTKEQSQTDDDDKPTFRSSF
jgi:hypothetical protein